MSSQNDTPIDTPVHGVATNSVFFSAEHTYMVYLQRSRTNTGVFNGFSSGRNLLDFYDIFVCEGEQYYILLLCII